MPSNPTTSIRIRKIGAHQNIETEDILAVEEPLEMRIVYGLANKRDQKSISVTMRTPGNDEDLTLGFLFTEGIVKTSEDVLSFKYIDFEKNVLVAEFSDKIKPSIQKLERNFYTTSSCGVCGKSSIDAIRVVCETPGVSESLQVSKKLIISLPELLRQQQQIFESTGGLHASALFNNTGEFVASREDVGRHNALDKLIGYALKSALLPLNNHVLILSGRASFELIQKAAMAGITIIAAVGAPSSLAVELAKEFNITLIGFLRGDHFNIYSNEQRIVL